MELKRSIFYKKELSFQVSCSYGPGRYDSQYEQNANDYPLPYVRWTAQRNFEAILYSLSNGSINTKPLITKTFDISQARSAYEYLTSKKTNLGILLTYEKNTDNINSVYRSVARVASTVRKDGSAPSFTQEERDKYTTLVYNAKIEALAGRYIRNAGLHVKLAKLRELNR